MILESIYFILSMHFLFQCCDNSKIFDTLLYDLHIFLENDEIFRANLHIHMRCLESTGVIWLNAVNLSILANSVSIYTAGRQTIQIIQFLDDEPNQAIGLKFKQNLTQNNDYTLKIGNFSGNISPKPRNFGLFKNGQFAIATQFQLNSARQVFPCFDQPDRKSIFSLKITFDGGKFVALSNSEVKQRSEQDFGIQTLTFHNTPLMSTYTFAFCLLPLQNFGRLSSNDGKVKFRFLYDEYRLSNFQVGIFMGYAKFAYNFMQTFFAECEIEQPIQKLDFVILNEFPIFGMENWGLIFLDQSFLLKNEPIEQLNLIAHEIVHQWIGNLVTNRNWSQICIQEGLAEHLTRKLVENAVASNGKLFGIDIKRLNLYSTERYLRAMIIETKNSQNGRKAIIQDYHSFEQAGDFCFGKAPFIFASVEIILGPRIFRKRLNNFVEKFAFKTFDIDDLVHCLTDTINIGKFMKYEMTHGAYIVLNVHKSQAFWKITPSVYGLSVPAQIKYLATQNQRSFIIENATFIPASDNQVIHDNDLMIVNADAEHFYRVNYDRKTWNRLSILIKNSADSLSMLLMAKLLNDYCYFYGISNDAESQEAELQQTKHNMFSTLQKFHKTTDFVFHNSFNCRFK